MPSRCPSQATALQHKNTHYGRLEFEPEELFAAYDTKQLCVWALVFSVFVCGLCSLASHAMEGVVAPAPSGAGWGGVLGGWRGPRPFTAATESASGFLPVLTGGAAQGAGAGGLFKLNIDVEEEGAGIMGGLLRGSDEGEQERKKLILFSSIGLAVAAAVRLRREGFACD